MTVGAVVFNPNQEDSVKTLPTWFRASLLTARNRSYQAPGVYGSYANSGYHLGIHWQDYVDDEEKLEEATDALAQVMEDDAAGARDWLRRYLLDFLKAVPPRRRLKFAAGFLQGENR